MNSVQLNPLRRVGVTLGAEPLACSYMRRHVIRVWRLERRPASLNRRTSSTSVEDFPICVELRWRPGER